MNLNKFFKEKGYNIDIKTNYNKHIEQWKSWYKGNVKSFHEYYIYNGVKNIQMTRASLQVAKKICEDWANLIMNERVSFQIGDEGEESPTNKALKQILDYNDFYVKASQAVEKSYAFGLGAFVLSVGNLIYDENTGFFDISESKINIEFATADKIFPLSWSNGRITEVAFATKKQISNESFIYISMHTLNERGNYIIKNYMLKEKGSQVIDVTDKASNMIQEFDTRSPIPWFAILKPNIANNISLESPFGISIYANSIDTLKALDISYDSLINEFTLGRKRIFVKAEALKYDKDGEKMTFDPNDAVFYSLPKDIDDNSEMITDNNMALRVAEHEQAIQLHLNILSSKIGFGENHYQFKHGSIQTATQIVSENSELFRSLKKQEITMESCLVDLFKAIIYIANNFSTYKMKDGEILIKFDDSIIEDKNSEMQRDLTLVNSGIMSKAEYRMKWFNESEEEANAKLPKIEANPYEVM